MASDRQSGKDRGGRGEEPERPARVTLKAVAEYLGLSPATVSVVLNRSPVASSIPQETQERVFDAARELGYRPNFLARSLRSQRSFSIGVIVSELVDPYATAVLTGIERHLLREGYLYLVASHRSKDELRDEVLELLEERSVEGFVLVNTPLAKPPSLPTVSVSGHDALEGVTNVILDHDHAAKMALSHLQDLGHESIAFYKGPPTSADTEDRWRAFLEAAEVLGVDIRDQLTLQLAAAFPRKEGYQQGYRFAQELLGRKPKFTALFAFDDVAAMGAIRGFLDAGKRVPEDISVLGFDDIPSAAFFNPGLTTVAQPLQTMGELAGRILLDRLSGHDTHAPFVTVQAELKVRGSTGPPPARRRSGRRSTGAATRS